MLNGKVHSLPSSAPTSQPRPTRLAGQLAYSHILVPTSLAARDRTILLLGLQLAAACGAEVSLLHVVPPPEPPHSVHWLDAIDRLYRTLQEPGSAPPTSDGEACARARPELLDFLETMSPVALREALLIHATCRAGDVAEQIARFTDEENVDLVILGSTPSKWSLPFWPSLAQRVLRLTDRRVLVVRSETSQRARP